MHYCKSSLVRTSTSNWWIILPTYVEGCGTVGFRQDHVGVPLELAVEPLEEIFEEQRDQLTSELQSFVPVVVLRRVRHTN